MGATTSQRGLGNFSFFETSLEQRRLSMFDDYQHENYNMTQDDGICKYQTPAFVDETH